MRLIDRTYYSVVDVIAPLQNRIPAVEPLATKDWLVSQWNNIPFITYKLYIDLNKMDLSM